jgi:hypothetical protein
MGGAFSLFIGAMSDVYRTERPWKISSEIVMIIDF